MYRSPTKNNIVSAQSMPGRRAGLRSYVAYYLILLAITNSCMKISDI